jgi:CheY-like chemotaxis protein
MRLELEPLTSPIPHADDVTQNGGPPTGSSEAAEILQSGIKAAQAGNRAQARTSLLRAAELDPRSESAWLWLASISEYPEELLVFLKNVLEINPANERALEWTAATNSLLGKTLVQRGTDAAEENQPEYAVQCFDQALEFDPQNSMAWLWLASLCDSSEGKIEYFEKVLNFEPQNETAKSGIVTARTQIRDARLADAKSAAVAGKNAEALLMIDAIISDTPDSEDAWILRSHLTESFEEKIRCYDRVLEINPDNLTASTSRASLLSIVAAVPAPELVQENIPAEFNAFDAAPPSPSIFFEEVAIDKNPTQELEMPEAVASELSSQFSNQEVPHEAHSYESNEIVENTPEPFGSFAEETQASVEGPFADFADTATARTSNEPDFGSPGTGEAIDLPDSERETMLYSFADDPIMDDIDVREMFVTEFSAPEPVAGVESEPQYIFEETEEPGFEAGIPMPGNLVVDAVEPTRTGFETQFVRNESSDQARPAHTSCPFCDASNDVQAIVCNSCMAILTLSDLEMVLSNQNADKQLLRQAIERMENDRSSHEVGENELTMLGIAHLNLRNLQEGYAYLHEASQLNPNNVMLSSQANALLIRIEEIKKQDEAHEHMPKGKTILVVDDSPTVRKLISGKLEKSGHDVFLSNDGVEAMERLEHLVPDLVLLDITMPRMDGYQVCKLIRSKEATKDIPVVMISGKDGFFDKVRGKMSGTTGYITKPFGPETLMKAVETYLKGEVPAAEE